MDALTILWIFLTGAIPGFFATWLGIGGCFLRISHDDVSSGTAYKERLCCQYDGHRAYNNTRCNYALQDGACVYQGIYYRGDRRSNRRGIRNAASDNGPWCYSEKGIRDRLYQRWHLHALYGAKDSRQNAPSGNSSVFRLPTPVYFRMKGEESERKMKSTLFKLTTIFAVLLTASFVIGGCVPVNHPPTITSLNAKQSVIGPLDSCLVKCLASDEDGDELIYEWSASKGNINGAGATVAWNAPEAEGIYNIVVNVSDGNGEEVADSITITVKSNHPPEIISLITGAEWLTPESSCHIQCNAEDPDSDELNYEWSADGGDISGTGSVVTWTAPDTAGLYNIAVVVTDSYGGESTRALNISIALNPPPTIESLIVTSEEPKFLREYHDGYKIFKGKNCDIECVVVSASDELVYQWSCDDGEISGEGSVVNWTAPSSGGEFTVTVTVSKHNGIPATESIVFKVETCSCAFR